MPECTSPNLRTIPRHIPISSAPARTHQALPGHSELVRTQHWHLVLVRPVLFESVVVVHAQHPTHSIPTLKPLLYKTGLVLFCSASTMGLIILLLLLARYLIESWYSDLVGLGVCCILLVHKFGIVRDQGRFIGSFRDQSKIPSYARDVSEPKFYLTNQSSVTHPQTIQAVSQLRLKAEHNRDPSHFSLEAGNLVRSDVTS